MASSRHDRLDQLYSKGGQTNVENGNEPENDPSETDTKTEPAADHAVAQESISHRVADDSSSSSSSSSSTTNSDSVAASRHEKLEIFKPSEISEESLPGQRTTPTTNSVSDIIGVGQQKDLATLEERHDRDYLDLLKNPVDGGPVEFSDPPTNDPTLNPTFTMMPTPYDETGTPTLSPTNTMAPTTQSPTVTFSPTTFSPTLTQQPTTTIPPTVTPRPTTTFEPTTTMAPTKTAQPTVTLSPTFTPQPTVSPKPTVTQSPTVTQQPTTTQSPTLSMIPTPNVATEVPSASPTITMEPTTQAPTFTQSPTFTQQPTFTFSPTFTPAPTPSARIPPTTAPPTASPTASPTSICFSTKQNDGDFGILDNPDSTEIVVPYRYEVELLPEDAAPLPIQEIDRPKSWGWGSIGTEEDDGVTSPALISRSSMFFWGGGRLLRQLQEDGDGDTTPEEDAARATLINEILPKLEIRISDTLLPVLFEEQCGGDIGRIPGRERRELHEILRLLQDDTDGTADTTNATDTNATDTNTTDPVDEVPSLGPPIVVGLRAIPPDVPSAGEDCRNIVPAGNNTCTVVYGDVTLLVDEDANNTKVMNLYYQEVYRTIERGMGSLGTYRFVDGRIVRLFYDPTYGINVQDGFNEENARSAGGVPAYPFAIVAVLIAILLAGLVVYRKRVLERDQREFDEDGNPLGDNTTYDNEYAPPDGDMMALEDGYDEYGDFSESQQQGQYLEYGYGDGGEEGYDDGYGDDQYDDGGGGFDTIEEEGEGDDAGDWGDDYGVNEGESEMQSMDEYSEFR